MNTEEIKQLLAQFDQSTVRELAIEQTDFHIYLNKNSISTATNGVGQTNATAQNPLNFDCSVTDNPSVDKLNVSVETTEEKQASAELTDKLVEGDAILSPIVGIAYLQPGPDKPVFKKVGDTVKTGEVVCIIEAMKLMNEIPAPTDGVITEIMIQNESVVEYNQPLFRIK